MSYEPGNVNEGNHWSFEEIDRYMISSRDKNKEANEWMKFGMRLAVSSALHPFEYAKVLIQVLII